MKASWVSKNWKMLLLLIVSGVLPLHIEQAQAQADPVVEALRRQYYEPDSPDLYNTDPNFLRNREIRSVMAEHGALEVEEGNFSYSAQFDEKKEGEKTGRVIPVIPWSSWFFPQNRNDLFATEASPLGKYDLVASQIAGRPFNARSFAARQFADIDADRSSWEGLCAPWSYASVHHRMMNLIQTPKMVRGVCFTPRDLKALIILTYERVEATNWKGRYGQIFRTSGPNARFSVQQDMYPAEWHRFVQLQLRDRRFPFIADLDATEQVWKYPIFKAEGRVIRDPQNQERAQVEMTIHYARSLLSQETQEEDKRRNIGIVASSKKYYYELFGRWEGNKFIVRTTGVHSMWQGKQRESDHPDFVEALPGGDMYQAANTIHKERGSLNPEINRDLVDQIVSEARNAPACSPGS